MDILRGVAILAVLLYHGLGTHQDVFQSSGNRLVGWLGHLLWQGYHGVHLFFVLSGFLITGILLEARERADYYRSFYTRRALRILPAYLLMLAVLLLLHRITWSYATVCLLCLCNMTGLFGLGPQYGPLWSLAVEEQFYFAWPFLVRHLSIRRLAQLCIALVVLTPALRLGLLYLPHALQDIRFKTWALSDFLAAGALVAIMSRSGRGRALLQKSAAPLLLASATLWALLDLLPLPTRLGRALALEPWLLGFTVLVVFADIRTALAVPQIMRPLVFLAKISYGLYLCHLLLFDFVDAHWPVPTAASHPLAALLLRFTLESAAAIAVATASRYTLEAFFLRRKLGPFSIRQT